MYSTDFQHKNSRKTIDFVLKFRDFNLNIKIRDLQLFSTFPDFICF